MDAIAVLARRFAFRRGLEALLAALARWGAAGLGCGAALVLAQRLAALPAPPAVLGVLPVVCGAFVGLVVGLALWPGLRQAAIAADARFGLQELLSSALLAGEGPMAKLVRADALRRVKSLDLRSAMPLGPPRSWPATAAGALALLVAALLPQMDLFGWGASRAAAERSRRLVHDATAAARAGLAPLARSEGGPDIARRVDRQLAELLAGRPTAAEAAAQGTGLQEEVRRAVAAAERALSRATDAAAQSRLARERAGAVATSRLVAEWLTRLGAPGVPREGEPPVKGGSPERFVRPQRVQKPPPQLAQVDGNVGEGRASAEAALRRDEVPWRCREVVRRYFTIENETAAPGR